jgi:hypothetical protein
MYSPTKRSLSALGATALLASTLAGSALAAGPVSVQLNGNTLNLNPAPTERGGRVFVPLRGVFENLGASVVYASGVINATGRGHSVSLKIGSQQATVDGQQQTLDVAPFVIGASTYVPLRFVSQALGATVNYDGSNRIVALTTNGTTTAQNPPPQNQVITPAPNQNQAGGAITLASTLPGRGTTVSSVRPTIEAVFGGGTVDPNTIKVYVDQLDVTNDSTRSPRGFAYAPRSPLQAGDHRVRVTGTDSNGQPFNRGWQFTSGTSTVGAAQITNVTPPNGATVGNQFEVTGHATPGAHLTVQAGVSSSPASIGGIIGAIIGANSGASQNSATYSLTADGNGVFRSQVNLAAPSNSQVVLVINGTDPQTGATLTPVQRNLTIR